MNNLILSSEDREQLEAMIESAPHVLQRRIRLLLLYNSGLMTRKASQQAGFSTSQARYWKRQFNLRGMEIFKAHSKHKQAEVIQNNFDHIKPPQPLLLPGILPDDLMSEAGRKILLFHFLEMVKHEAGTITGENIEELHDMRVATRRMRAAFGIFGEFFISKTISPYLQILKITGRSLGEVRDLDVSLIKVHLYLKQLPTGQQSGLAPLLDHWSALLDHSRQRLLSHLNSQEYLDFKSNFSNFVQSQGMGSIQPKKGTPKQTTVRFQAPTLIYSRLSGVMAFGSILNIASYAQLHALRIEFKRLRYTLEFFKEVLGIEAQDIVNEIKKLQDHLGELNDANVACQIISSFLKKWDKHQNLIPLVERVNPEPIVNYLASRYAERYRLMIAFPEMWLHFTRPELRQGLSRAVAFL